MIANPLSPLTRDFSIMLILSRLFDMSEDEHFAVERALYDVNAMLCNGFQLKLKADSSIHRRLDEAVRYVWSVGKTINLFIFGSYL